LQQLHRWPEIGKKEGAFFLEDEDGDYFCTEESLHSKNPAGGVQSG